ncbi:MAG: ABC transporter ATP-binding protein [Methyloversatilis discipulorum]|uniref:ABC transporter ATP-binding protein n=1 Tax=Methyloversatilis discipulorum TaxID=1119528 RepID=UPI0026F09B60|nr:ABC transporter ATP-binding protein [Methyloversatilis discipulorum]MBT9516023.1 ABC transporter ATP-binding protein [Methyloversatilis discipulorum]
MSIDPRHSAPPAQSPLRQTGALSLKDVRKHFDFKDRALTVLTGFNLDVRPGEFLSIVGPSGCGKSTLLRLISGLDDAYEGSITLDGTRVAGTSLERGLVFQDHRLFPWMTLEDNIGFALIRRDLSKVARNRLVRDHIALVGLDGFEKAYPHQLSGGMTQRAAIARALVNEPKVLLLDEPFGALDALTRVHMQTELQRIWMAQGSTMIMITHDVEEALYLGDRVAVMQAHPGRITHIVDVDLPHPRDRASPLLHRLKDDILAELTATQAGRGDSVVHLAHRRGDAAAG